MRAPPRSPFLALTLALVAAACSGKGKHERRGDDEPAPASGASATPSGKAQAGSGTSTAAVSGSPRGPAPAPGGRPNILFIVADDQRADSLACMPRLAKMFDGGTTFTDYFASTPLCCPARTTLLTGRYAHNHGVLQNGDVEDGDKTRTPGAVDFIKSGNENRIIAKWLHDAGYRTAMFGKYLNGYDVMLRKQMYVPPNWDDWHVFSHAEYFDFQLIERAKGETRPIRNCVLSATKKGQQSEKHCRKDADNVIDDGQENHSTDVLEKRAVAFLREAVKDKAPFFMYFAPKAPHGPFQSPRRYQPDPKKAEFTKEARDKLGTCSLFDWNDRPASFMEKDVSDKPTWIQEIKGRKTVAQLDELRRLQLVSVLATEDAVEEMLSVLEAAGQRDNTILVYVSDNGFAWGEHGYSSKNCAYGACSKVPFLFLDPRKKVSAGRTVDAFVADIDIAPTLAALGGAAIPAGEKVDGMSLLPLLSGEKVAWPRQQILTECWGNGEKGHPDTHASARTKRWLYVEHYTDDKRTTVARRGSRDDVELYDLERDPFELDNLASFSENDRLAKGYAKGDVDKAIADMKSRLGTLANAK